ncbi:hypothetical protein [Pyrobaculum neutrophilum]|uniref:Uncharacterized protein n=1 Tax=Pyrobaculum neutrophilum (strain DSM 2338 / JCM 9278 / NBRC 100436 / V24Sta) TaxID=444157 RepID=B1YAZ3_PYRNV|nr:hypothetical protein [Pyrobaculum neutrophilum]ACB40693.1 conserved hypothetical protein [Pyrobaculum neutrophilum V24Sta]
MYAVPPAVILIPLASKEQVLQTVNYVVGRLRQIGAPVRHAHSDSPLYLGCRVAREEVERVDVYLATAGGDFANVLPQAEEIKEGFVERKGYVHLVQGVAICFRYQLGQEPRLAEVVVYTVGAPYRDFKLNL